MTAAQGLYAEGKAITANSTTWVDVATIADGSFTAGDKYLIVASALVRSTSSAEDTRLRLVHGAGPTAFTDGSASYELLANVQETNIGWAYLFTQPGGGAETVKIQVSTSSTATVTVELGQIFALNLDDVGTEDTDWRHNEVTADYTTTSSFVAQASETWTPNGTDDYLVIAHGVVTAVVTTTSHGMRINDSVAGVLSAIDVEGEDATNDIRSYLLMSVYTPSNASHTISADFMHTTNAVTVSSSRIFVLNLNKFAQHAFSYDAAEDAPAAAPNWTTTRTVSPTPSSTGSWFYWGSYNFDAASTASDDVATRLQVNAAGGGLVSDPDYTDSSPGMDSWDSSDVTPFNIFNLLSLSSGAARDINLDVKAVASNLARVENRCLVAFSLELPAAGGAAGPLIDGHLVKHGILQGRLV